MENLFIKQTMLLQPQRSTAPSRLSSACRKPAKSTCISKLLAQAGFLDQFNAESIEVETSEPPPILRNLSALLYIPELEMFVSVLHTKKTQKQTKQNHENNLGYRKQNSLCKNAGVGEGHGAAQWRQCWPSRPQVLNYLLSPRKPI